MRKRHSRPGSFALTCRWSRNLGLFAVYLAGQALTGHYGNTILLATGKTKEQALGRAWGVSSDVRARLTAEHNKACQVSETDIPLPITTTITRTKET